MGSAELDTSHQLHLFKLLKGYFSQTSCQDMRPNPPTGSWTLQEKKKKAGGLSGLDVIPLSPLQPHLQTALISSRKLTFKNKEKGGKSNTHAEALKVLLKDFP